MHLAPHYLLCCDNSFLANKVFYHVLLSLFNCAMESTDGKNGTNNHFIVSIDLHCTINLFWSQLSMCKMLVEVVDMSSVMIIIFINGPFYRKRVQGEIYEYSVALNM